MYDQKTAMFENVTVGAVLQQEERRENCVLLSRKTPVPVAISEFCRNPFLEAILFTENGKKTEMPLGIATRWDIPETK